MVAVETDIRGALLELRGRLLIRRHQFVEAAAAVEELAKLDSATGAQLYGAACTFSMCAAAIQSAESGESTDNPQRVRQQYIVASIAALQRSIDNGWTDQAELRQESRLSGIKDVAEFKSLIAEGTDAKRANQD